MSKEELMGKELCNLYAIAKQVNSYFNENEVDFLSNKGKDILGNYRTFTKENEEQVLRTLRNLSINPGNTTDSIVYQIIENLDEISSQEGVDNEVMEMGYTMSLNRLINYHYANIANIDYGTKHL